MNYGRYVKYELNLAAILFFTICASFNVYGGVLYNFDDLPATASNEIPGSSASLLYTTEAVNPMVGFPMTAYNRAGWRRSSAYVNSSVTDYFQAYSNSINSPSKGYEWYGYLEVDDATAVRGNALKHVITGGKNALTLPDANGLELNTKQEYLNYLSNNQSPSIGDMVVGTSYIYFSNTSNPPNDVGFPAAQGTNRLSFYIKMPAVLNNGIGGWGVPPTITFIVGPYSSVPKSDIFPNGDPDSNMGGHFYHWYYTQGGGWTHIVVDSHPEHSNAVGSSFPYPSSSFRDIGGEYFNNMFRLYTTGKPYEGLDTPPFSFWIDEMEFISDSEPQNNETINNPAVMYLPGQKLFEISFNDKYANNAYSKSTYEVRYSFSQITNENWGLAPPVLIQPDTRFGITASSDGRFRKWRPHYKGVWAPFKIDPADEAALVPGSTIYFAIKDVSQENGDGLDPVGGDPNAGRLYAVYPSMFDYAGDKPALPLIKRINYYISNAGVVSDDSTPPQAPSGVTIMSIIQEWLYK